MTQNRRLSLGARVFKHELSCFLRLCEAVNTPRSVACYLMASAGEWNQYLALTGCDPESARFADDYLVSEAMRKNPHLPTGIDTKATAIEKWWEAEMSCRKTNEFLDSYLRGHVILPDGMEDIITKAQRFIAQVLGPLSRAKLELAERSFRFGPGATSVCSGSDVLLSRKMTSSFDVTPRLYPFWRSLLPSNGADIHASGVSICAYNRVTFVPKDAKTDRAIAIEPHGNIYVQLGIGALLRRQMSIAGLNLDTQASKNSVLARRAYTQGLSTIDLSSASDTIATELVRLLLPPEWFDLLCLARCDYSLLDGKQVKLEKFSSMGNGFTFELESLIFWSLTQAVGDPFGVAFGDDIIIDRDAAPNLIRTLNLFGFSVNAKKTFLAGSFFESCGSDYWRGVDVRPLYFKGRYEDFTSCVIRVCNKIRLYARRRNLGLGCDQRFLRAWIYSLSRDDSARRTGIPLDQGDAGIIRCFDECTPPRARHGHEGYVARVWRGRPQRSRKTVTEGAYLSALAFGSTDISRNEESTRGATHRPQHRFQVVPTWNDPGAWCSF